MNWTRPSEEQAVSVVQGDDDMTNHEKIKEMSIQEIAEFICDNTRSCNGCVGRELCVYGVGHANGIAKWLEKEVCSCGEE